MRATFLFKNLWRGGGPRLKFFDILSLSGYYDTLFRARRLTMTVTVLNLEWSLFLTFRYGRPCR